MAEAPQQRVQLWATDADDEELQDVDLTHTIGSYVQTGAYDDGEQSERAIVLALTLYL